MNTRVRSEVRTASRAWWSSAALTLRESLCWAARLFLTVVCGVAGAQWTPLGTGTDADVNAVCVLPSGGIIAGGAFLSAGGGSAPNVARWDGAAWSAMGAGPGFTVNALCVMSNGDIIAGGGFSSRLARWNGTAWSPLSEGTYDGAVNAILPLPNGELVAGGSFTIVGGVPASRVARWDGSTWHALGTGVSGTVNALARRDNGDLIVGGNFGSAGGISAERIATWDGTGWAPLGAGFDSTVNSLAVAASGEVFAGGSFSRSGGLPVNRVARWNGSAWSALDAGVHGTVSAIGILPGGDVVVGGAFTEVGEARGPAMNVARWDGSGWSSVSTGRLGALKSIAVTVSGELIAGSRAAGTTVQAVTVARAVTCGLPIDRPRLPDELPLRIGATMDATVPNASSYRWYRTRDHVTRQPLLDVPGTVVGTSTPRIQFLAVDESLEGSYSCEVVNTCGDYVASNTATVGVIVTPPSAFAGEIRSAARNSQGLNSEGEAGGQYEESFSDLFGASVAVSGQTIVVGAPWEDSAERGVMTLAPSDDGAPQAGAAFVYVFRSGSWELEAVLKASNADPLDEFGWSVAISGDTVVVGAPGEAGGARAVNGDPTDNSRPGCGAVYVFVRSGGAWSQTAYIKASDAAAGDAFGSAVAISGSAIVVGAPLKDLDRPGNALVGVDAGAAYVYERAGSSWTETLAAAWPNFATQPHFAYFGESVSISGGTFVVGASGDADRGAGVNGITGDAISPDSGAAFVYSRAGSTWSVQAVLKANNAGAGDLFGISLSASGDSIIVGAPLEDSDSLGLNGRQNNRRVDSGASYIFGRVGSAWVQQGFLKDRAPPEELDNWTGLGAGSAVACSGSLAAMNGESRADSPRTPLCGRVGAEWREVSSLLEKTTSALAMTDEILVGGDSHDGRVSIKPLGARQSPSISVTSAVISTALLPHTMTVAVQYARGAWSSIDSSDLELRRQGRPSIPAVLVSRTTSSTGVAAVYRFEAPGGTWDSGDNGLYELWTRADQVVGFQGLVLPAIQVRGYSLWFNNPGCSPISEAVAEGGAYIDVSVLYEDWAGAPLGMSWSSVGNGDVELLGPGGTVLASTLLTRTAPSPGRIRATYRVPARGGYWDWTDNGRYTLRMRPSEVWDQQGFPVAVQDVRALNLSFNTPSATVQSVSVTAGSPVISFVVMYRANGRFMDWTSIGSGDVEFRGPFSYVGTGTLRSKTYVPSNNSYLVVYECPAPGGSWEASDNGSYFLWSRQSQVWDALGFAVPPANLAGYSLWF